MEDVCVDCFTSKVKVEKHLVLPVEARGSRSLKQSVGKMLGQGVGRTVTVDCGQCEAKEADQCGSFRMTGLAMFVQLGRTISSDHDPTVAVKLGHNISVPLRFQPKPLGPKYVLTGAAQQLGEEAVSGHYVCVIRDIKSGVFTFANDDRDLTQLTEEEAERFLQKSYLLAYCREDWEEHINIGAEERLAVTTTPTLRASQTPEALRASQPGHDDDDSDDGSGDKLSEDGSDWSDKEQTKSQVRALDYSSKERFQFLVDFVQNGEWVL